MKRRMFTATRPQQFYNLVRVGLAIALLVTVLVIVYQQPVHAATIAVNTVVDEDNTNGNCSLREAIYAANHDVIRDACIAGSGTDEIDLTGVAGVITLAGTELAIISDLTISGPGADQLAISGNDASRVFSVAVGAEVVISDVTIANGNSTGGNGGGISNAGTLTINRCTFSNNLTTGNGGGIANYGTATINSSTFFKNKANLNGGGVYNKEGTLIVNNSTFSENRASEAAFDNYGGGGICNMAEDGPADLMINNSTIAFNSAMWGGGISNFDGTLNIKNTIVAENTVHTGGAGPNCHFSSSVTTSYNLESGTDCGFTGTGDLQSAAAEIEPLQNNGGSTWTHALQPDSQAIDAGSCSDTNGNPVTTDQRGAPRISPCDIGAYENPLPIYLPLVRRD